MNRRSAPVGTGSFTGSPASGLSGSMPPLKTQSSLDCTHLPFCDLCTCLSLSLLSPYQTEQPSKAPGYQGNALPCIFVVNTDGLWLRDAHKVVVTMPWSPHGPSARSSQPSVEERSSVWTGLLQHRLSARRKNVPEGWTRDAAARPFLHRPPEESSHNWIY